MISRTFAWIVIAVAAVLFPWAGGFGGTVSDSEEVRVDRERIEALGKSGDLEGLDQFTQTRLETWERIGMFRYGHLVLKVVQTFASEEFENDLQYKLAERYARFGLQRAQEIPLEVVMELLRHTEIDLVAPDRPRGDDWVRYRAEDMELWLQAWKRVNDAIDPGWDPSDLPESKVAPPPETHLPAGVVPEAIEDPTLRSEYEAAIEANRRKAERYGEQYRVRKLRDWFLREAERYIVAAYSEPPLDPEGMRTNLERYVEDEKARTGISEKVRANTGS